jgi:hypothetical protein
LTSAAGSSEPAAFSIQGAVLSLLPIDLLIADALKAWTMSLAKKNFLTEVYPPLAGTEATERRENTRSK